MSSNAKEKKFGLYYGHLSLRYFSLRNLRLRALAFSVINKAEEREKIE